jgi:predicted nucleic acid-binding protein
MIFVADAGPLISFARADRLELLRQGVGELWIPEAVYQKLVTQGTGRPGAAEAARGEWMIRKPITQPTAAIELPSTLGEGEREAIMLAHELRAAVIVDDADARDMALRLGVSVLGSL